MTRISSLSSRNVLACAISSAVLLVVSVFWFRKKRKIKELPALGPSGKVEENAHIQYEQTESCQNIILEKLAENVTSDELPAVKETVVKATYSEPDECNTASNTSCTQLELSDTLQEGNCTDSVSDSFVKSACEDYTKQNHVNTSESNLKEEIIFKSSINDSFSVPGNFSADCSEEFFENQGSCSDLIGSRCSDVASSDTFVSCHIEDNTDLSAEVQSQDLLNEIHILSDDSSSTKHEVIDGEGGVNENLLDSCSKILVSDCRDTVDTEQLGSSSPNSEEMLPGCEGVGTAELPESDELNSSPLPENLNCTALETCLPQSCSRKLSGSESSVEISESAEFTSLENSDQSEKEIPNIDSVAVEQNKSVEENGERLLNCENEDKISISSVEEIKDHVEECSVGIKKAKEMEKHMNVLNGNDEYEDESVVSSLPNDTIPETENITTDDGSIECNDPLSPASEWVPEEKSVTVSSSVSLSDSAPLSPTLTVDEEFINVDDATLRGASTKEFTVTVDENFINIDYATLKGASTESEKLRTCESTDSVKSRITNFLFSEELERDHLDNVLVPSKNPVTDLSKPFSGVSSPQPDIPASISNENLTVGLQSIERQINSSPSCAVNHLDGRLEGSPDSGKGSDVNAVVDLKPSLNTSYYIYEFELPQELCGRLIGKQGKYVKYIKERSNSNVLIKRHPFNPQLKLVVVEGTRSDVNNALELIRKKFPPSQFPNVSLAQTHILGVPAVPESSQLHLPDGGVSCDVILSSLVNAGHFFLQQPTHPTYPSLSALDTCMMACYSQMETPRLPQPVEAGVICAATIMNGWYRAQIVYVYESGEECDIKFVDYGGFSQVPVASLRQIRSDFMSLPFQASECYLANVLPQNEELSWTPEASAAFEELAQGQILQAVVVSYADDGIPYVELYRVQGITSTFINQELVDLGVAKWVSNQ